MRFKTSGRQFRIATFPFSALMLLAMSAPAIADPPKVLRSSPANGAKDVPTDLAAIRIRFDQPMKMNGWTLWQSQQGVFPTLSDSDEDPWLDPQTFEQKIKGLKPNTTYAVQLNSDRRQSFRSADANEPLPVTTIVFTTGAGPKPAARQPADQPPAEEPKDPGKTPKNPLDDSADAPQKKPKDPTRKPKNPLDDAADEPKEKPRDPGRKPKNPLDDAVDEPKEKPRDPGKPKNPLDDAADQPREKPKDPGAAAATLTPQALSGTWLVRTAELEITVIFKADGTCSRRVKTAQGEERGESTFSIAGTRITFKPAGAGETITLNAKLEGNCLELTDGEGNGFRLVRQ